MTRKRWTRQEHVTPSLLKFREKRKWQITLRRYVIQQSPCPEYAPYFGLDIKNLRQWFEDQFVEEMNWENFGKEWQFEHLVPVTYFDFSRQEDLSLCWNFTNLRVEKVEPKDRANRIDVLVAKNYFRDLFEKTGYPVCQKLLHKIESIEVSEKIATNAQQDFLNEHREYLGLIEGFTNFEFELLNSGKTIAEVQKEMEFLKNLGKER